MEPKLVMQFGQHQTAKALWKSLVTTFGVRADPVIVYDLEVRINKLNQGAESLEEYWAELQNLWVNIDSRRTCPYTCCDKGISIYHKETELRKLYQFLSGLHDRYDGLRRDVLKETITPSAEEAFAFIKQEATRIGIWKPTKELETTGIGSGFRIRPSGPPPRTTLPTLHRRAAPPRTARNRIDKSRLVCTHCGMSKHTKDTCFQLVGYPEWWEDGHKANRGSTAKGREAVGRDEIGGSDISTPITAPVGGQSVTYNRKSGSIPVEVSSGGG